MSNLNKIIKLIINIAKNARQAVIFPNKCNDIADALDDLSVYLKDFDLKSDIKESKIKKIEKNFRDLNDMIEPLKEEDNFWLYLHTDKEIIEIDHSINKNLEKSNSLLKDIGATASLDISPENLYNDLGLIDDLLSNNLRLIQQRQKEVKENLKQTQKVNLDYSNDIDEENKKELQKYKRFNLTKTDYTITSKFPFDTNPVFNYFEGEMKANKEFVTVLKMNKNYKYIFKRLLSVLTIMKHPYVEQFKGARISKDNQIEIVTNRSGHKLANILYTMCEQEKFFESGELTILIVKIVQAMVYLHSRSIIHRDLSSQNIYVTRDSKTNEIKPMIVGFRNSRKLSIEFSRSQTSYNINSKIPISFFRAPELDDGLYDEKVDVFAFSGILYELVEGHPPYNDDSLTAIDVINKLRKNERPTFSPNVPEKIKNLIENCWKQDPNDRFTFMQILKELITKKIVFEANGESNDVIEEFYKRIKVKDEERKNCLDAIMTIKQYIGRTSQYRFELLRIRSVLNSYQFLIRTPKSSLKFIKTTSYSDSDDEEDEDEGNMNDHKNSMNDMKNNMNDTKKEAVDAGRDNNMKDFKIDGAELVVEDDYEEEEEQTESDKLSTLYGHLKKLQNLTFRLSQNEFDSTVMNNLKSMKGKLNPSEDLYKIDLPKVTIELTSIMNDVYEAMKNLGFKNIEKYEEVNDDIVYDYRELKSYFIQVNLDAGFDAFNPQIEQIDNFIKSRNLNGIISDTAFHNRLKDLFSPFSEYEVNRADYKISDLRNVKKGGQAKVHLGRDQRKNRDVAIKEISKFDSQTEKTLECIRMEIGSLIRYKHKYISEFIGYSLSEDNSVWFLFKYYKDGLLHDYLHTDDKEKKLSPTDKTKIAFQVAEAMAFIHLKGRYHHDLKPSNIMIDGKSPRIIDFGYSLPDNTAMSNPSIIGTPMYAAPEVLNSEKHDSKADVFSFAVTLWEMYSEVIPDNNFRMKIVNNFKLAFTKDISKSLYNLINDCWNKDPKKRPTFRKILSRMIRENIMFPGSSEATIRQFYFDEVEFFSKISSEFEKEFSLPLKE